MKTLRHIYVNDEGEVFDFPYEIITPHDVLIVFPEARKIVKKLLITSKKELNQIQKEQKEVRQKVYKKCKNLNFLELAQDLSVILHTDTARQNVLEKNIADYGIMLRSQETKGRAKNIMEAKNILITDFVNFNRQGVAKCLWHSPDNNPSMKYYPKDNRVWCFACQKGGDVIDVIAQINNCSISEALKILTR